MNYDSLMDPLMMDEFARTNLERRLEDALYPVEPRPEYVRQVRVRLALGENDDSGDFLGYMLFALAGVASSILLVVAGVKATRTIKESWHDRQMKRLPGGGAASATGAV